MNVQAISAVSLAPHFEGGLEKKANNKQNYPQIDAPMSKVAAQSLQNSSMISFGERHRRHIFRNATVAAGLGLMTLGAMTSCAEAEADAYARADAKVWVWGCGCNCKGKTDTIWVERPGKSDTTYIKVFEPIYVKEYPFHLADSLIRQGMNIGINPEGPIPSDNNNDVVFIGSVCRNRYDNIIYDTKLDSIKTNGQILSLYTKCVDKYDDENPKTYWLASEVTDVPNKGIMIERRIYNQESQPKPGDKYEYAGYEIRTNLKNGYNRVEIHDKNGNVRYAKYHKDEDGALGSFLYGAVVYDPRTGLPLNNQGEPVDDIKDAAITEYKFDQAKIYSDRVTLEQIPENGTYVWGSSK